MLNYDLIDQARETLLDRYSVDELVEVLGLDALDIFEAFQSQCLDFWYREFGPTEEDGDD